MEFVAFVLCMSIIAQINAAAIPESGSSIPHQNNEFELPPIARKGFEMILDVTIDGKYNERVQNKMLKAVLLPNEDENSDIVVKFCEKKGDGMHICILPDDETLLNRSGETQTTTIHIRVTAVLEGEYLKLFVYINDNNVADGEIPLSEFEQLKHFSVGGITGHIQTLHFDFTGNAG